MPRAKGVPKVNVNVRLPEDLVYRVRKRLEDPVRNKTQYGSISDLLAELLYEWDHKNDTPLSNI